jgi:hypothetical protein
VELNSAAAAKIDRMRFILLSYSCR